MRVGAVQVASYMRAVLRTIAQCHHHRILHRDIKPGNFMLLTDAEDAPVKAIDFGLALFFDPKVRFGCARDHAHRWDAWLAPLRRSRAHVHCAGTIVVLLMCARASALDSYSGASHVKPRFGGHTTLHGT